jgi:hypothetical protein
MGHAKKVADFMTQYCIFFSLGSGKNPCRAADLFSKGLCHANGFCIIDHVPSGRKS